MKKTVPFVAALSITILALLLVAMDYSYVGASACKLCHKAELQGRQFTIWESSLHSKSFANQTKPAAAEVGKAMGVADPPGNAQCLGCHSPLAAKAPELKEEGVGGDAAATGPWTSIEAVAAGRRAARSIHNYLRGEHLADVWDTRKREARPAPEVLARTEPVARQVMAHVDGFARTRTWDEVSTGFTMEQAVAEAQRCLNCAVCSECYECVRACGPGAFLHDEEDTEVELVVGAVVLAPGFDVYDPANQPEYGYGRYPNILSALEYERMLSASGPNQGEIRRPSDGRRPKSIGDQQNRPTMA